MKNKKIKGHLKVTAVNGSAGEMGFKEGKSYTFKLKRHSESGYTDKNTYKLVRKIKVGDILTDEEISNLIFKGVDFNNKFLKWKEGRVKLSSRSDRPRLQPTLLRYAASNISAVIDNFSRPRPVVLYLFESESGSYISVPEVVYMKLYLD